MTADRLGSREKTSLHPLRTLVLMFAAGAVGGGLGSCFDGARRFRRTR